MSPFTRKLLVPAEGLVYGPAYAFLQHLIRSPQPLPPEATWQTILEKKSAAIQFVSSHYPIRPLRWPLLYAKLKQDHFTGIAAHYDVSNDFYELFLDKKYMFYSCADFPTGSETLDEAQQIKADFILNLIDPQPGQKILELGCGWGSMLKRIYEQTGDTENLYGLTLSQQQVAYNEEHGGFHVEFDNFITRNYEPEAYDTIYSVGAWEHVRPREVGPLSKKLYAAIKPGGKLVKHFFCREGYGGQLAVSQIYFPGSIGSSYRANVVAFEEAGFRITHRSIHDYRPTLRAWFDNLVSNRDRALELVDVQTYNRYITFFPAAWRFFEDGRGMLVRWVMEKPARTTLARARAPSTTEQSERATT